MRYALVGGSYERHFTGGRVQVHARVVWRVCSGASLSDMNP